MIIAYSIEASGSEQKKKWKVFQTEEARNAARRNRQLSGRPGEAVAAERKVKSDSKRRFIVKAAEFFSEEVEADRPVWWSGFLCSPRFPCLCARESLSLSLSLIFLSPEIFGKNLKSNHSTKLHLVEKLNFFIGIKYVFYMDFLGILITESVGAGRLFTQMATNAEQYCPTSMRLRKGIDRSLKRVLLESIENLSKKCLPAR